MSKKENASTLYNYVKDYIIKLIVSQNYEANQQLPTEYELMKELGVGRATVRAALAQLEADGTIYKKQGVGTFVAERSKNYGLEPFISFDFYIKKLGLTGNNKITINKTITVTDGPLCDGFRRGSEIRYLERVRYAETTPVALEKNYFSLSTYEKISNSNQEHSMAHTLLGTLDSSIHQINNKIIVRLPSPEESKSLKIGNNEKVVELTRWIYAEGDDEPVSYLNFTIPTHVLDFPFIT